MNWQYNPEWYLWISPTAVDFMVFDNQIRCELGD